MAVSQSKMLGHYAWGPGGYKCPCCKADSTRYRKTAERRELSREFDEWASWYDTGEGRQWLEAGLAEAQGWPGWDPWDCQHGCNGACENWGGEGPCTFMCHPESLTP